MIDAPLRQCRPARLLCLCLGAVLALTGCGQQSTPSGTGSAGNAAGGSGGGGATSTEELRLVVLSPALAVTLVDLGLEDRIVGRHAYDLVLRESLPVCGDQGGIDYERLIAVDPTHVLLEWGTRELPARLLDLAGDEGWELSNHRLLTLDQVATTADDLHERFVRRGPEPGAPLVVPGATPGASPTPSSPIPEAIRTEPDRQRPSRRMATAWTEREDRAIFRGSVLLVGATTPVGVLGPGSAHHELLGRMGATPAIADGSPWITLDTEDLITLAPEAVVLVAPRPRGTAPGASNGVGQLRAALEGLDIPAVTEERLGVIDHPHALLPSTALIEVADDLRALLEGWAE